MFVPPLKLEFVFIQTVSGAGGKYPSALCGRNVFTVYVTAQITDEAVSTVYAEKRILAIVDRSVDPIRVRYFRWIVE